LNLFLNKSYITRGYSTAPQIKDKFFNSRWSFTYKNDNKGGFL
jgi:hypothetical protein